MNANEERTICKRITDLERSLPFAEPLEKIDRQMDILRQEKGKIGKAMNQLYQRIQELSKEIEGYDNDIDETKKNKEEGQKNLDPTVASKK